MQNGYRTSFGIHIKFKSVCLGIFYGFGKQLLFCFVKKDRDSWSNRKIFNYLPVDKLNCYFFFITAMIGNMESESVVSEISNVQR